MHVRIFWQVKVLLTVLKLIVSSSIHFDKPNWARTKLSYFFMKEANEMIALRRFLNRKGEILKNFAFAPQAGHFSNQILEQLTFLCGLKAAYKKGFDKN